MKKFKSKHTTGTYFVGTNNKTGRDYLYSYGTPICIIDRVNMVISVTDYYEYSNTTKRHLRWFFEDILGLSIGVNDIRQALNTGDTLFNFTVEKI